MSRQLAWMAAAAFAAVLAIDQPRVAAQQTDPAPEEAAERSDAAEDQATNPSGHSPTDQASDARDSADTQPQTNEAEGDAATTGQRTATRDSEQSRSQQTGQSQQSAQPRESGANQAQSNSQVQAGVDQQTTLRQGLDFGQRTREGLTISTVQPNSVFFDSGIRPNDVIVSIDGRPVRSEAEFFQFIRPGARVPMVVYRGGQRETIYVEMPQQLNQRRAVDNRQVAQGGRAFLGVVFDPQSRGAAFVQSVQPGSPAEQAGLQPGDAILALNNQSVQSQYDAMTIVNSMRPGDHLTISFERPMESQTEAVLTAKAGDRVRTATREQRSVLVPANPPIDDNRSDLDARPDVRIDRDFDRDRDRIDRRLETDRRRLSPAERRALRRSLP